MPFPSWKKKTKKNNTISQFFKDHIQSHRQRGGTHLVVETGFPTSLVDLIVKNRRRFKRSSEIGVPCDSSFVLESPPPPPAPTPVSPPSPAPLPQPSPPTHLNCMVEERDSTAAEKVQDGENCKGVLMALFRVSLVVVLAFGTKKFAVGLTMSAFFLIFVEYLRKHHFGMLIPCSDSRKELGLVMVKVLRFMGIREEKLQGKNERFEEEVKPGGSDLKNDCLKSKDSIVEIQNMQSNSSLAASIEGAQKQQKGIDKSASDGNSKLRKADSLAARLEEEEEYPREVLEIKKKKSQRGKIRSKLKHMFSGKSGKEEKEGLLVSNACITEERNAAEEVQGLTNERKQEGDDNLSSISGGSNYVGKESITPVCGSDKALTEELVAGDVTREVEESQKRGNSGYLFLCAIVLIGLSVGRISALLLILACCLMKKSGGKLGRGWIWPVMRHFCPDV